MAKKKSSAASQTAIWILMGLLILSLGGFGITQLGGSLRSLGEVGDKQVDIDQYARQLSQEINLLAQQRGAAVPFSEAQALGIDSAVLARLVRIRALDHETAQLGLSVGDETLRGDILAIQGFQGIDGEFDRDAYAFALEQAGLTEAQFENRLREEAARTILQGAIVSGTVMPDTYVDTLVDFAGETRAISLIRLDQSSLDAPLPDPSPDELRAYHAENQADFQIPATRQLTYVLLTPEMMLDEVTLDEATLRAEYDDRAAEFNVPESRLVERLPFLDQAAADAAAAQLEVNGTTFDALVEARGLTLEDVDLGDVGRLELDAAGEAVFAAEVGDVVGPLPSTLGPALFRINGILPAVTTSFEDARIALQSELALGRASRMIEGLAEDFDDQLAGGATLEQLGDETPMQLSSIDWYEDIAADVAGYPAFRAAAARVQEGDFPQIEVLEDGGIFALRLDGTSPARDATYDEVTEAVLAAFEADRLEEVLTERAAEIVPQLQSGVDAATLGLTVRPEPEVTRSSFLPGTAANMVPDIFEMAPGEIRVMEAFGAVLIVRLEDITLAADNPEITALRDQLQEQVSQSLGQALLDVYTNDTLLRAGQRIDQRALQAVHVNFP
ncbi:MAG: SurA N-terminal domain-containing protein [Pseudomonadota bacterium]